MIHLSSALIKRFPAGTRGHAFFCDLMMMFTRLTENRMGDRRDGGQDDDEDDEDDDEDGEKAVADADEVFADGGSVGEDDDRGSGAETQRAAHHM